MEFIGETSYYRGDYIYEPKTMGEQRELQQKDNSHEGMDKWLSEGKVRLHDCCDWDRDTSRVDVRIRSTVLTQPGTPVSFRGIFICLLFDFRKLQIFQCFPFPENSGTPTFPISGNSGL